MKYYVIHANKKKRKKNELGLYESISCLNSNEIFDINFGAKSKNINYINKQGVKFVDLNKNSIIEEIKFSEEEQMLNPPMKISTDIFVLDENVLGCTKEKVHYVQHITKLYMD